MRSKIEIKLKERCLRRGGAGLGFTVANDADGDEVRVIHDCTEGDGQSIAKLSAFMDASWSLGVDMAEITVNV
jgi:hypothetical protein